MSRIAVGVQLDPLTGRPMRALWADEAPSRARPSVHTGTPAYRGRLAVPDSTTYRVRSENMAANSRAYRARKKAAS